MQRHGVPVSTIHLLFACHADVVVISRALGDLLVVKGKYGVYSISRAINNERIADSGDINYAMRADTPGFQTPSDNASCRALLMLFHDATGGAHLQNMHPRYSGLLSMKNRDVRWVTMW